MTRPSQTRMQLTHFIFVSAISLLAAGNAYAAAVPDSGIRPPAPNARSFNDSIKNASAASFRDSGTMVITLQHATDVQSRIDSVYLIMDRYDRRGAGVVKQIYYPVNNQVTLTVRKGRYYASIFCLGRYNRASFDRVLTVKAARPREVRLRMQVVALFTPGQVQMPKEKWDPAHLAIMQKKR